MLTIVVPTKNEASSLPNLLQSITSQSVQPLEVIVADAHSTDATVQIAKQAGCVVVEGGMPGVGRNRGAQLAKGDILLFLDADVVLRDPRFIEHATAEFLNRAFDFATCAVEPISQHVIDKLMHGLYNRYMRMIAKFHPVAPGFCIFARRSKHEAIQGFDESITFCEDHDYVLRGARIGSFGILRTVKIPVSVRRLERDGRFNIALKYLLAEFYIMLFGPIRNDRFRYTFGHK